MDVRAPMRSAAYGNDLPRRHVSGLWPDRGTTYCDDGPQLQIWDEDNKPVQHGETGEIVAKGEGQMRGFWNNPEATAERIVDGWAKTGDVGHLMPMATSACSTVPTTW